MATIAKDAVLAALAATEVNGLGFCGLELNRREAGAGVAAVTEGLILAQSTGAPVVTLTCLHLNGIWRLLRDCRYWHLVILRLTARSGKLPCLMMVKVLDYMVKHLDDLFALERRRLT